MEPGVFERNLRKLNRNLRIYCGDDSSKPAGVFLITSNGETEQICGVDKNYVPEYIQWNEDGSIKRGGWRRVLRILIQKRLIDRWYAEKVFHTHLAYMPPQRTTIKVKPDMQSRVDEIVKKYK